MPSLSAARFTSLLGAWRGHGPAYRDLADAVRVLVVDARVPDGTTLPSERTLAEALDVSRTTTARAYEELRARGLLSSRRGSGSIVTVPLAESSTSALLDGPDSGTGISMTHAAAQAAPGLGAAFERALDRLPALLSTTGYLPDGYPPLRERIAARYAEAGLPTDPSQILVTSGAQGALAIVFATLVARGDNALVEACGFPHAFDGLVGEGGRLLPLPHAATPWSTPDVRSAAPSAQIAYFVPDFHNPTGALMPAEQREDLARALRGSGVVTVADETIRDVNLEQSHMPPHYAQFDPDAVTIGSLSKSAWGGLRIGWIRAPHHLVSALVQARMRLDLGTSAFEQVVAVEALGGAFHQPHLQNLRRQRDALVAELGEVLPEFRVPVPAGGLSLWVTLPRRASSRLVAAASDEGLRLLSGPRFFSSPGAAGEQFLRLPFAQPDSQLRDAVARLARAWSAVEHGVASAPRRFERDIDLIA